MRLFPKDRNLDLPPDRVELEVRASDLQQRPDEVRLRLDAFLALKLSWRSRTSLQHLIASGHVLVSAPAPQRPGILEEPEVERRAGRTLRNGTRVVVVIPLERRLQIDAADPEGLVVLHEDEHTIVVDKPPFLPVHPSGRHHSNTLIQRVQARQRLLTGAAPSIRLCHRLDRETSGLVLCGKGDWAHRRLRKQFERQEVEKEYLAIVSGLPLDDSGRVDLPLGRSRTSAVRLKMAVQSDGDASLTEWSVVERFAHCTLVACRPQTGRQHQIRVHMAAIGHPLVGDKLYGLGEEFFLRNAGGMLAAEDCAALGLPRHALHNHRLSWSSPATGERILVVSALAPDLRAYLERQP